MAGLIKTAAKAGQPLSEAVVWRHFSQIADALAYMHEKRVMHRDLKPANVFVTETNHVKLGDLGVGRHFSSKTDMVHSTVGTPYYMSPECIQGKTGYDFKSDLWSLGCSKVASTLPEDSSPICLPGPSEGSGRSHARRSAA